LTKPGLAFEARQHHGSVAKVEYWAFGQHWRATAGVTWIRGAGRDSSASIIAIQDPQIR
jgi:hypothetical protein